MDAFCAKAAAELPCSWRKQLKTKKNNDGRLVGVRVARRQEVRVDVKRNLADNGLELARVEHSMVVVAARLGSLGRELVHVQERRPRRDWKREGKAEKIRECKTYAEIT
jgi:hypothetical protein